MTKDEYCCTALFYFQAYLILGEYKGVLGLAVKIVSHLPL
jgi:hypothetical protein